MNSNPPLRSKDLFPMEKVAGPGPSELIFEIEIPGRLPSWNDILGMEQWARYKFKKQLADDFLCALRRSAGGSSTKITSAKSTLLTFVATLELYLATRQAERKSKLARKKSEAKSPNLFGSKSSNQSKVPF